MPSSVRSFVSLKTKFTLIALGLATLFSIAWGTWTWHHDRQSLLKNLNDTGTVLVSSMSIPIINALIYEELGLISEGGLLDNFIIDIMDNSQLKPVYALVTDKGGKIIAHSEFNRFGETLNDEWTVNVLNAEEIVSLKTQWQHKNVLDIGSPLAIHGKRWGCLRVGFPLEPLQKELQRLALQVISLSCLSALGATLLFFIVGSRFAGPLRKLTQMMERVDGKQLPVVPESSRQDELGLLQNSFSQMLSRLQLSEQERDRSVQKLLESERLVTAGRIVSGVAHEINNPLSGMIGALNLLQNKPESVDRFLPIIKTETERLSDIVTQLLDLSRAGEISREFVNTEHLCNEIKRICQLAVKGKKIKMELCEPVPAVRIECDPRKLQQVVLNLVINASDALEGNGRICVKPYVDNKEFCLQVEDDGPGIPPELKDQIFTPFFTTKPAGKGTGIGLGFCLSTIEKHGGTLRLLETSVGACFEIRIPMSGS